jgi:integrase/recombinase XerC
MGLDFISYFEDYIKNQKRYSLHTIQSYLTDLKQFNLFLGSERSLDEVSHFEIRSWIVDLQESGHINRSIRRKLASLQLFYKLLKARGYIHFNPLQKVVTPKLNKKLPEVIQQSNLEGLAVLDDSTEDFTEARNSLILRLFYETGVRRSELIQIKLSDFDFQRKTLKVLGKGKKERLIPIGEEIINTIKRYLLIRSQTDLQSSPFLFLTEKGDVMYPRLVHRIVGGKLQMLTTIKKKSPHVLRHSFATHLADGGADIFAIKELLGHSSLQATQIYTHTSMGKLLEMYQKCHPRGKKEDH